MKFKQIIVLLMFIPLFGYSQQHGSDPLRYRPVQANDYEYTRVYTPDLACKNQKDTIVVQVLTEPFDDYFFDVVTELQELTRYKNSREKKYCTVYYDIIGVKDDKLIMNVTFGVSEW